AGGEQHAEGREHVGRCQGAAGVLEHVHRGRRPAQLVCHPARQLVLADGGGGDTNRRRHAGDHESQKQHRQCDVHAFSKETCVTRRWSTCSTTTRKPSSVSSSPGRGTRPSTEYTNPPTVETSACAIVVPSAADSSSRLARPSTQNRAPSCRIAGVVSASCSSRISPTISSRMSSRVMSPDVPPNSSTTIAMCAGVPWKSRSWLSSVLVSGTKAAGRISVCQRIRPAAFVPET